jgi:hypothetical protein
MLQTIPAITEAEIQKEQEGKNRGIQENLNKEEVRRPFAW